MTSIDDLNMEFEPDYGFFDFLRDKQVFHQDKAERFLKSLDSIIIEGDSIDLELVKLIWSLPILLQWQADRAERHNNTELSSQISEVLYKTFEILEEKIGLP